MTPMRQLFEQFLGFNSASMGASSRETLRTTMQRFFDYCELNDLPIEAVTTCHMAEFMVWCQTEHRLKAQTINARVKLARRFFGWLVDRGGIVENPVKANRLPRLQVEQIHKVPFTHEQYQRLLRELTRREDGPGEPWVYPTYWHDACVVAWHTGLRASDVADLQWSSVRWDDRVLHVRPIKRRRAGQRLDIPIEDELFSLLLQRHNERQDENPHVIPIFYAEYTTDRKRVVGAFRRICDRVGLTEQSLHSFRHSMVSRLLNAGVDPITIGSITGQTIEVIKGYAHVSTDAKVKALAKSRAAFETVQAAEPQLKAVNL